MSDPPPRRLALIVNPYAGLGGPLALGGSDTAAATAEPSPQIRSRVRRALRVISSREHELGGGLELLAAPGEMGAVLARSLGLSVHELEPRVSDRHSTADDTRRCAKRAQRLGADLILFAGGDGTARDVTASLSVSTPVLGIPGGVKMHSGVFAASPEQAGDAAVDYLLEPETERLTPADVVDADESARRDGRLAPRLYGQALVPRAPGRVLSAKAAGAWNDDGRLLAACASIAKQLDGDEVHLIGPGTTTARVLDAHGLEGTLLGVDAVQEGRLIGRDLDERGVLAVLAGRPAKLVLGVVGGQGMLLGRGNQQLSPTVLRRVRRPDITVLAARDKLLALTPGRLHVDTGDATLDAELSGWLPVRVGPRERLMMEVGR